jgi:hypothetical protein
MIKNLAALRAGFSAHPPKLSSTFPAGDPRGLRPLSLEQQKKRAKERLRSWRSAVDHPRSKAKLSDAQHAIAQEFGFTTWMQLKAHIEQNAIAQAAVESGMPTELDGDRRVLHIRCGTDIMHSLAVAGFSGDFLAFYDPYVHGPVPACDSLETFLRIRADYIAQGDPQASQEILADLQAQYTALEKVRDYDAVYIWLEHDPFDQLILVKLLDYFSVAEHRPASLHLISTTSYPGVEQFNSIAQLPPTALRVLWQTFNEVTPQQIALGQATWSAIQMPEPDALYAICATGTPAHPLLSKALDRYLQQLPSKRNGLNLSENLSLQILLEKGDMNAARLFGWYTNHYEPLTFMGDSFYWRMLEQLAQAKYPAIVLQRRGDQPNQWWVRLTEAGRALLKNKLDWIEVNGINSWLGGVRLNSENGSVYRYRQGEGSE